MSGSGMGGTIQFDEPGLPTPGPDAPQTVRMIMNNHEQCADIIIRNGWACCKHCGKRLVTYSHHLR